MTYLTYHDKNMFSGASGAGGAHVSELKSLSPRLKEVVRSVETLRKTGEQGFFDLPYDTKGAEKIAEAAAKIRKRFSHLVVVGIGGSDLGARTIIQALNQPKKNTMSVTFLGNPDPETINEALGGKHYWSETAICVISKSGTTLETMSIFMALRESLIAAVGLQKHGEHIVAITDPKEESVLRKLAKKGKYTILDHPLNVGGRFSVLSVVGLFPAACAGVDIKKMLAGAKHVEASHRRKKQKHEAVLFAALHYLAMKKRRQPIHVVMPYADRLSNFGLWFRQIWAESLGKDGKGPTPVGALGTTDQHSQIQLYNQGPNDKVITFIRPKRYRKNLRVPTTWKNVKGIDYMAGLSFQKIMHAEHEGTAIALAKHERPNATIEIPSISPESLGALFMFFQIATAYMGELMAINTYNQPGVEEGKKQAKELLK